jgi:hypothetical protein
MVKANRNPACSGPRLNIWMSNRILFIGADRRWDEASLMEMRDGDFALVRRGAATGDISGCTPYL